MAHLAPPPTPTERLAHPPRPLFTVLPPATRLLRLFDPTRPGAGPVTFRFYGPLSRFDHQRGAPSQGRGGRLRPAVDEERGVLYAGFSLSCCVVEVFGDGQIEMGNWHLAEIETVRPLRLLDLRGRGAMRAGTIAALCKTALRPQSQAWARYFYEDPAFESCEGIRFFNAHNDEEAICLWERAQSGVKGNPEAVVRLDHQALRPALVHIAAQHNLTLLPVIEPVIEKA